MKVSFLGRMAATLAWTGALALSLGSCASTDERGNAMQRYFKGANITVKGWTLDQVQNAVTDAFVEAGYKVASGFSTQMTFERDGRKVDQVMYGFGEKDVTLTRATVVFGFGDDGAIEVEASGNVVRDVGGMTGEEKMWLPNNGRFRFQKILDRSKSLLRKEKREQRKQSELFAPPSGETRPTIFSAP